MTTTGKEFSVLDAATSLTEKSSPMPPDCVVMRSKKEAIEYIQKRYPWMSAYSIGDPEIIWKLAIDILFIK